MLFDSLMHLPPPEVDTLHFVSRAYNSLVGKQGARLPKHSINLHSSLVAWMSNRQPKKECFPYDELVAWFTEQRPYNSYGGGLTPASLESMLGSVRLGRISKITLRNHPKLEQVLSVIRRAEMKVPVGMVSLLDSHFENQEVLSMVGQLPNLKSLEVSGGRDIFKHPQLYRDIPHFTYHFPSKQFFDYRYAGALSFLTNGRFGGRVVFTTDSIKDYYVVRDVVCDFIGDIIRSFAAVRTEDALLFPRRDFLLLSTKSLRKFNADWEEVLGRPDEDSRHIARWPGGNYLPENIELGDSSWKVWRVRNSNIPDVKGTDGKSGEKHLRVMQKIEGTGKSSGSAAHFQLFGFDGYAEKEEEDEKQYD